MNTTDIIALIITCLGVFSFALVITILYRNYVRSSIEEIKSGKRDIELIDLAIYESDPKIKKRNKAIDITKNVVYYTFLVFIIPIFGLSIYSRIKNNVTMIGDNAVMVVASGSMSQKEQSNEYLFTYQLDNQFQTYDMITLTKVKSQSQLELYDVIAFRNNKNINVIHRIIKIDYVDGAAIYTTKGDANTGIDSYQPKFEDIIGKYTGKRIPAIGIFIMFFQSYAGMITVASVVYCMFMISHYSRKSEIASEERTELLSEVFDFSKLNEEEIDSMNQGYNQFIYYQGYQYLFDESGFVNKTKIDENNLLPNNNSNNVDQNDKTIDQ